jgi:hypothetical protein
MTKASSRASLKAEPAAHRAVLDHGDAMRPSPSLAACPGALQARRPAADWTRDVRRLLAA